MVACPLCILGVPEEEHSPERFASITDAEREIINAYNKLHPGILIGPEEEAQRKRRLEQARAAAGEDDF